MPKKTSAQLERDIAEVLSKESNNDKPRILKISRGTSFAGQRSITVTVQYAGEEPKRVEFVGPTSGAGPVVMVTGKHQTFVTDPSRFGAFGQSWVRRFFA